MGGRVKVSLTIDEDVLAAVDREAARAPRPNRSQVVERVLRAWSRQRRQALLDEAIEAYYVSLSAEDAAEDDAWAALGDETASAWDDDA